MFSFFKQLPEELILDLVNSLPVDDQARLAQTSSDMNRIVNHPTTGLTHFKFMNRGCQIGRAVITFIYNDPPFYSQLIVRDVNASQPAATMTFSVSPHKADELAQAFDNHDVPLTDCLARLELPSIITRIDMINHNNEDDIAAAARAYTCD
ncbi:hypothetical protein AQUSIP_09640 [Aquicella siphonis]|uniref:F-box domain-containing protein n=1 Tax=Aquicella siphonis TaxID=254247 RepID=A0A5E4PFQ5_9COXI|nr:F-box protein [Aquicella siphonis]VVC75674.1 hypothetical protein AQUSIP_09640 [Aquicella siphonis]